MKYIQKVQTFDGKLHDTTKGATRYLDLMYTEKLSRMTAKLCGDTQGKYIATKDWLHDNLDDFLELNKIRQDMIIEEEED